MRQLFSAVAVPPLTTGRPRRAYRRVPPSARRKAGRVCLLASGHRSERLRARFKKPYRVSIAIVENGSGQGAAVYGPGV